MRYVVYEEDRKPA